MNKQVTWRSLLVVLLIVAAWAALAINESSQLREQVREETRVEFEEAGDV